MYSQKINFTHIKQGRILSTDLFSLSQQLTHFRIYRRYAEEVSTKNAGSNKKNTSHNRDEVSTQNAGNYKKRPVEK
uniref:Uncharacterized protein n=1 Tax=Arion vulgaris TaxID=1028688 RepID=A0A0B6YV72_9EUPU